MTPSFPQLSPISPPWMNWSRGVLLPIGWYCCCHQFCSIAQSCQTCCNTWTAVNQASLSITNSRGLLKFMSIKSVMSPSPPAFNLSQHQGLSNESILPIRWPKYRSFSFSTSPSNESSGLTSFRINWFDLLAVRYTWLFVSWCDAHLSTFTEYAEILHRP